MKAVTLEDLALYVSSPVQVLEENDEKEKKEVYKGFLANLPKDLVARNVFYIAPKDEKCLEIVLNES